MNVLIVDDEINIRQLMSRYLKLEGIQSSEAENGLSAQRMLREQGFDACIIDLKMPGMNGLELIQWIRSEGLRMPIIMISAHGEISDAVTALKEGAQDYIVKPFDPEELVLRLKKLVELQNLRNVVESESRQADSEGELFIGESPQIRRIKKVIEKIADTTSMVLITGESGTGKEVIARRIHQTSPVADGPFVAINIGGVPENLIESELFGYEKGAFTGAVSRKIGMFELAGGGTLFLDEIGDMPLSLQVKILRVLQDRKIIRLGGTTELPINARIIAATNKDLEERVRSGSFREDLFYRLNVVRIHIPPLRQRREDIPLLAAGILKRLNREMGHTVTGISADALNRIVEHEFYGNVRELENILERAMIFATEAEIQESDLDLRHSVSLHSQVQQPRELPQGEAKSLKEAEIEAIIHALHRWEGNRTRAAEELGISRRTLINKIAEYKLSLLENDMKSLPRWDLVPIYPGPQSAEFLADIELVRTKSAELEARLADEKSDLQTNIEAFELILDHMGNLGSYAHALVSTDTANAVYLKAMNRVEDLLLVLKPLSVRFMRHLAKREDEIKARGADDPYAYVLQGLLIEQKHLMSDELEEFAADLARSSWDAFSRLQQSLGSSISAEWEDGRMKTVVELRNMATDGDRAIRKKAFEKELELLEIHEEAFAAALNGVKGATISLNARRGWESPLERSIFQSRIDSEILSALITTLEEAVPLFRSYLKKKAELLGLENLAFYDLFAPVGKSAKRYSYEDAQAFIVEHFSRFSEAMGKFAQNAFEKNWIDPEPRKGKVGGAYDTSFPVAKESRILSNFDYTYSGVSTIAHELGHAYHDSKVMQRGGLLANYPMPLAETASIFCEGLIFQGALEEADEEERIVLIEAFLQDSTQVCLDILSRFYFEEEVFKRRKEGDITASELNEMMLDAQKRTYGPALDVYHPYMWAVKSHYYRPEFSHYNYPYAFGQLFGLGLSKRSEDDPSAFVEQYDALLSVSGMKSVRDVGLEAGIDLGDRSFWQEGIEVIARYVEEFKGASPH